MHSLQAVAKQRVLKGAITCKWNSCEHSILDQKIKVKFDTTVHQVKGLLDVVHMDVWDQPSMHHLVVIVSLCHLLLSILGGIRCTPSDTKEKS